MIYLIAEVTKSDISWPAACVIIAMTLGPLCFYAYLLRHDKKD